MNLVRDTRQDDEEALAWKLTTEGLAKCLEEKNLKLIGVNGALRVVDA